MCAALVPRCEETHRIYITFRRRVLRAFCSLSIVAMHFVVSLFEVFASDGSGIHWGIRIEDKMNGPE